MSPPAHAAISLGIGAIVWLITRSTGSVAAALLAGVLIDLDHIPDYYRWLVLDKTDRIWFFAHSYEYLVPMLVASYLSGWNPLVIAGSLAFLGHLLADQLANPVGPFSYFLTYRISKRFYAPAILSTTARDMYKELARYPLIGGIVPRVIGWLRRGPVPW